MSDLDLGLDELAAERDALLAELDQEDALLAELEAEYAARWGDPRRCRRHPHIRISSPNGMHDGVCGQCEYEADGEEEEG